MSIPTPDEMVERVRMALAEVGYGDGVDLVSITKSPLNEWPLVANLGKRVPEDVWWQANCVAHEWRSVPCWSCGGERAGREAAISCANGNCTAGPDEPRVPPRRSSVYQSRSGEVWVRQSARTFMAGRTCSQCDELATHWGLCEPHAREDDPDYFAEAES